MACATEHILQIVYKRFLEILSLRHAMIVPAIDTFSAGTSREVHAEVGGVAFLEVVSFCEACVDFSVQFSKRWGSIHVDTPICQVLVIPDVVVVIALFIRCFFLSFFRLTTGWSLHPLVHLEVLEQVILSKMTSLSNFFILLISTWRSILSFLFFFFSISIAVCVIVDQGIRVEHCECLSLHLIDLCHMRLVLRQVLLFVFHYRFLQFFLSCMVYHIFSLICAVW